MQKPKSAFPFQAVISPQVCGACGLGWLRTREASYTLGASHGESEQEIGHMEAPLCAHLPGWCESERFPVAATRLLGLAWQDELTQQHSLGLAARRGKRSTDCRSRHFPKEGAHGARHTGRGWTPLLLMREMPVQTRVRMANEEAWAVLVTVIYKGTATGGTGLTGGFAIGFVVFLFRAGSDQK